MNIALFHYWVVLAVISAGNPQPQWPGWRGLDAQGVSTSPVPVEWSSEKNIKWHTAVPGSGHSSPVVAADKVFVTAATKVSADSPTRNFALKGLVVTAGILTLALAVRTGRPNTRLSRGLVDALLLGVCLGAILQIRIIESHADSQGVQYALWLQGFVASSLAVAAMTNSIPRRWRVVPAFVLFAGGALMLLARPNAAYYRLAMGSTHSWPTLVAFLCVLLAGVGAALRSLRGGRPATERSSGRIGTQGLLIVAVLAVGVILTLSALLAYLRVRHPDRLFLESIPYWPYFGALVLWLGVSFVRARPEPVKNMFMPALLSLCVVGISLLAYSRPKDVLARSIVCIDRSDGSILWTCSGFKGPKENTHGDNSPATPTPVIFGDKVLAWFGTPGLMCCDFTGKLLWVNTDLPFKDIHGVGASPIIADGKLVIVSGNPKEPYIMALDPDTGQCLWRTGLSPWTGIHGEHRTPLMVSVEGRTMILNWTIAFNRLTAYSASDGRELWKWDVPLRRTGEAVASIVSDDDKLYLSDRTFVLCARMGSEPTAVWEAAMRGKGANTASPLIRNELLFTISDAGWASCLDADTGRVFWQQRLAACGALASPIAAGDCVYFPLANGTTVAVACDRQFRRLGENTLPGRFYASPAPVGGQLILRTTAGLWCVEEIVR